MGSAMSEEQELTFVREHRAGARGDARTGILMEGIVRAMTEMELGRRPYAALDPVASPMAARRIRHLLQDARRARSGARRSATEVLRVRTTASYHPMAGVVEGVVLAHSEQRTRAYSIRLEQEGVHWRLVELAEPGCSLQPAVTYASRTGSVYVDRDGVRRSSAREWTGRRATADGRREPRPMVRRTDDGRGTDTGDARREEGDGRVSG